MTFSPPASTGTSPAKSAADDTTPAKAKPRLGSLRALWPFVRMHGGLFTAWLIALAVASAATLSLPWAFGRMIESLNGRYITAVDSGTSSADMDCIAQQTQHVTSTTAAGDPSPHTAMGVFAGIRATALARLGSDDLQGLRVAVQGLGNVGFALAEQLAAAGVELFVSDLDPGRVQLAVEQLGAHPVSSEELLLTPCDILAPCGLGGVLNAQTVGALHCAAVAGSANNQLAGSEIADALEARGILYAPDYVINSGGLIYVALKHRGEELPAITAHLTQIGRRLTEVYAHAQADKRSPARVADALAERLLYGGR